MMVLIQKTVLLAVIGRGTTCRRAAENEKRRKSLFSERLPPCFISNPWIYRPEPCPLRLSGSFPWSWTVPLPIQRIAFSSFASSLLLSFLYLHLTWNIEVKRLGSFFLCHVVVHHELIVCIFQTPRGKGSGSRFTLQRVPKLLLVCLHHFLNI